MELKHFRELIGQRLGLRLRHTDEARLRSVINSRLHCLKLDSPEFYLLLLRQRGPESEAEWAELSSSLTTQETFFFRDAGQFALLRDRLLPELIARHGQDRKLRIWSAGCASGEEPYSLAMLLHELLPERNDWELSLWGTDLDQAALHKGRRGMYSDWSFRRVDPYWKHKFFRARPGGWEIIEPIRALVNWQSLNLVTDEIPSRTIRDMDLVLCRNVFIYFDRETITRVVGKIAGVVVEGGVFITGHGEVQHLDAELWSSELHAESMVYRRRLRRVRADADWTATRRAEWSVAELGTAASSATPGVVPPAPLAVPSAVAEDMVPGIKEAERALQRGDHALAAQLAAAILGGDAAPKEAHLVMAQALANLGDHARSVMHCRRAMELDPLSAEPWYLLAQVAEEDGRLADAREFLRKALYLAPDHIAANLAMAEHHERDGDRQRAHAVRLATWRQLKKLRSDAPVQFRGRCTAGELASRLESKVKHG